MVELLDGKDYQIIDKIELPRGAGRAVFNPVDHNYSVESGSHEPGAQTHKLNIIDTQNFGSSPKTVMGIDEFLSSMS